MEEPYYFGEYFDLPPITENIGKVARMLKMKLDAVRGGLERDLQVVHAQSQAAHRRFEFDDKVLALAKAGSPASV